VSRDALRYDVVVVGAGTAGSATALHMAALGLKVALVDARPLASAGPAWAVLVPPRMFDQAGIPRPAGDELISSHFRHLIEGPEPHFGRVIIDPCPAWSVAIPPLVRRLHAAAASAGATHFGGARLTELTFDGERPVGCALLLDSPALRARRLRLRCGLLVDASGLHAAVRRRIPTLHRCCPPPRPDELCHAVQYGFEVTERSAAATWLEATGQRPGDFLARNGLAGAFSTASVQLSPDLEHADLLTGTLVSHPGSDANDLMRRLVREHPWLGRRGPGGSALIPVRRPYALQAVPGAALVGDAACQVFPSHGSGIGSGLLAARLLADTVQRVGDAGAPAVACEYGAAIHQHLGPTHAAHEAFRRGLEAIAGDMGAVVGRGFIQSDHSRATMDQAMPPFRLSDLPGAFRSVTRAPLLGARMAPLPLRMLVAHALAARRPGAGASRQRRWARRVAAAVGAPTDPT
jgi:flavin-dependent dehydrogenase